MTPEIPNPELQELVEIRKLAEQVQRQTNELRAEIHSLKVEIDSLRGPPTQGGQPMKFDDLMERLKGCIQEGKTEDNRREVWLNHSKVEAAVEAYVDGIIEAGETVPIRRFEEEKSRATELANTLKYFNEKWAKKGEYIAQLEKEIGARKDQLAQMDGQLADLRNENAHLRQESGVLQLAVDFAQPICDELNKEIQDLTQKLAEVDK